MAQRRSRLLKFGAALVAIGCASLGPAAFADAGGAQRIKIDPAMSGAMQNLLRIRNGEAGATSAEAPAPTPPTDPISLVNNPTADLTNHDTQSETTVIFAAGKNAVSGFNDSGSYNGANNHFTGWSYSADGGKHWTDAGILPTDGVGDAGDPSMAYDVMRNQVYFATLGFNNSAVLRFFTSTDQGHTFGPAVNPAAGNGGGAFLDKEWIAVDNWPGTGQGNVYLVYRDFGAGGGMKFNRSTNGGVNWSNAITVLPNAGQGAWVTVGPDHSVYYFFLDTGNIIKVRRSTDLGLTFGAATTVIDELSTGVNGDVGLGGFRSNGFPQAVVSPSGVIFASYNDNPAGGDRADVYLKTSIDNGATWSVATKVNDDATTNDNWSPSIALNTNGSRIAIGYYDRSADGANNQIQRRIRTGTVNAGGTIVFNASVSLSPNFPPVFGQDPVINSVYMGDYDQIAGTKKGFLTTWGDNRDSDAFFAHQPDVRRAVVKVL